MTNEKNSTLPILTLGSFKKTSAPSPSVAKEEPIVKTDIAEHAKATNSQMTSSTDTEHPPRRYQEVLQYLQTTYPLCFPTPPLKPVPLAIKIHEQILKQEIELFSNTAIRSFLKHYVRTSEYKEAKKTVKKRYNLDGTIASKIKQSSKDKKQANSGNSPLPHDSLFKRIMENNIAAKEFLNEYLPIEVKDIIDLDTIKVQKESYIEPNLTKRLSDIVYSVNTKDDQEAFIYAISEHQSSVDQLMAFRLWKYTLLLAERHIDKKEKIPLIFPIVVYAGKAKYTAPRNLWSLFEYPELAKKLLIEDHALVDLEAMSDDEIAKKKHLALFEYIMKHVQMRDMLKLWQNLFEKLPDAVIMDKEHGYFYISNLLWYIDGQLSEEKRDELSNLISEHLPKTDGENIMRTIADSYIDEGISKGIVIGEARGEARGVEKIAIRMLKENTDPKFISSVTGLSTDEILKLKNKF